VLLTTGINGDLQLEKSFRVAATAGEEADTLTATGVALLSPAVERITSARHSARRDRVLLQKSIGVT
jgi:hypothetical protein